MSRRSLTGRSRWEWKSRHTREAGDEPPATDDGRRLRWERSGGFSTRHEPPEGSLLSRHLRFRLPVVPYGRFSAGFTCPRWQVVQFTIASGPLRFGMFLSSSLLIVATILLMSRAVCFCVLSSLSHSPGV